MVKIKDVFTGTGERLIIESIDVYTAGDLASLSMIPVLYLSEYRISLAASMNDILGHTEFDPDNIDDIMDITNKALEGVEIDPEKIMNLFKVDMVDSILAHNRFRILKSNTKENKDEIDYAKAMKNANINNIPEKHKDKFAKELKSISEVIGLDLDKYKGYKQL